MKKIIGKISFVLAFLSALTMGISWCMNDGYILFFPALIIFIIASIGVCICAKELKKYLIDLLDFI